MLVGSAQVTVWLATPVPSDTELVVPRKPVDAFGLRSAAVRVADAELVPAALVARTTYEHPGDGSETTEHATFALSTGQGGPGVIVIDAAGIATGAPNPDPVFTSYS